MSKLIPLVAIFTFMSACGDGSDPSGKTSTGGSDDVYNAVTEFSYSCGGGVAGTYGGTTIKRDGTVIDAGNSATDESANKSVTFQVDRSMVEPLFKKLQAIDFFEMKPGAPSNYCCSFTLKTSDRSHTVIRDDVGFPEQGKKPEGLALVLELARALPRK